MKTSVALTAIAWLLSASAVLAETPDPAPIRTENGFVRGQNENGLTVYRGIPFAAPPVGERRWRAPEPVGSWDGTRRADQFAPACMQLTRDNAVVGSSALPVSEDCLYLNIWTPAKSASGQLPVMVWLPGGGFIAGATSTPTYGGDNLARKGVVVVSVAYRIGAFGFLATPELSAESGGHGSGNYGLLDQIAALKWVQRNIAAFGGDPNRVTVFGESAGGIAVSMLAASNLAKGLFVGAISESGGSFAPARQSEEGGENVMSLPLAERIGREFLDGLGAHSLAEARQLPAKAVVDAAGSAPNRFWPTLDGYVIADDQYELYRAGKFNDTPVLIGTNSDEGAIFAQTMTAQGYAQFVKAGFGDFADRILNAYPAGSPEQSLRSFRNVYRETAFAWHTWAWADLQSRIGKGKVFVYYFDHRPPYPNVPPYQNWGAAHGGELSYVFGHHERPSLAWTPTDMALADAISTYWVNFAKTGDPNGAGLPAWPAFSPTDPAAMHFTDKPAAGPYPNLEKLRLWDNYYAWRRGEKVPDASQ